MTTPGTSHPTSLPSGERQRVFAKAILDPALPVPPGLLGLDGACGPRRFAVYRNNVVAGLIEALAAGFPVVRRLVGAPFFDAMARAFVVVRPPCSPVMLEYGAGFAAFIAGFPPAACLPYLPDVARLERAWLDAYHAPEAIPLDTTALARTDPSDAASLQFVLHPSLRLVRSPWPILAIWRAHLPGVSPAPLDASRGGEDVLVLRPYAEVELRRVPPGAAACIAALAAGRTLADAADAGWADHPAFDLSATVTGLLVCGAVTGKLAREGGR